MDATAQELIARLRRDPNDSDAFAALRAHYQRIGDYASLANLLEGWAGRSQDKAAAARAMYDAGELVLSALADRERSISMYERGLSYDPRHQDTFLRLRGLYEDAGEMRRLAELLERQGAALTKVGANPRDIALLYHQLGEIWEHRFARVDKAVGHYRKAFELDGKLVAAIYAAREIYRAAGNLKAAATLLEKEAKAEADQQRKVALWRELAHMRAEELEDQEGASLALKRALQEVPGDLEVMSDLARVYLTRAQESEDEHIAASDRHRAADLLYQMAQHVPAEHALAYLEQSLDARPDHDGAMSLYERIAAEMGQEARLPGRWVAYLGHAAEGPETAHRRKRLANAYLEAGQAEYAITCLEWLLEDEDAEAAETLVDLYRRAGREDDAIRALAIAVRGLPPGQRVPRLRELITALRDRGEIAQAGQFATEILRDEPGDPEALHMLEESCRQTGEWLPLREALLSASRLGGLDAGTRKQRLKQVALLSERQLDDPDGAISAWRGAAALDPSDIEARAALKRLLTQTERWDELVALIEREAIALTAPRQQVDLYRELAALHRDRRGDLEAAITALRSLRDLAPEDTAGRDALADLLLEAEAYLEAVPLLRRRAEEATGEARAEQLRLLAGVLEERVGDDEGAFEVWAQVLDALPTDLGAIDRMIAIDEGGGRYERLLSTLSYKIEISAPEAQAAVLAQMGSIADSALTDLDRAAELYARALELAPGETSVLDALCDVYDRSDRYKDLVVLLRATAMRELDGRRRAELYRRIARTLAGQVGNDDGAAEAWREVLVAGEDEEALRFLRQHATRRDDPAALEHILARLSTLLADVNERREALLERAALLSDRLERPRDAIAVLRAVVEQLAPEHVGALAKLAALCEQVGDLPGLADALWRQLAVVTDPGLRVPLARRLADLHEKEAPEIARAIDALYAWAESDPRDPVPRRRLVSLLESASRWKELADGLDQLADLEESPTVASGLVRRSAEVAYRQLGDIDGAWARLEPRVRGGDEDAEADLRHLARSAGRGAALCELFVDLAQGSDDPEIQKRRWMDAAVVQETYLDDLENALEAALRAFAVDLSDHSFLDEADRLAEAAGAWPRLGQVYETLVRRHDAPDEKVELLLRWAAHLDERAHDVSAALDQTLRACALASQDDAVLAVAEERAPRAGRSDELLISYDKRRSAATDDAGRVEALLRSGAWCERALRDRARTQHYLAQAVALTVRSPELSEAVEGAARALDAEPGAAGGLRRAVADLYAALADDMEEDPVGGARLLLRASRVFAEDLSQDDEAFAALKKAAAFGPAEADVLDELERVATQLGRLAELDHHLAHLIEEALDNRTASGLLRRRGLLLEEQLERLDAAAEVWTRLSSVTQGDPEARNHLRACLRKAGKHQDLLVALQRDLRRSEGAADRVPILVEIARIWDEDLANRWEAEDAWRKVQREAPDHADAAAALERLGQASRHDGGEPDSLSALLEEDEAPADANPPGWSPLAGTDQNIALPEAFEDETSDAYSDLTVPSEEGRVEEEPDETVLDDGLFAELRQQLRAANPALSQEPPRPGTPTPAPPARPKRDAETAQLRAPRETRRLDASQARDSGSERVAPPPPPRPPDMPMPGPPDTDFEEDYTAVADDVFDQLRDHFGGAMGKVQELGTGEIELLDADERETFDQPVEGRLDLGRDLFGGEVPELGELEGVVELEEELEEIEELDDLEELSAGSAPPPPPRRD